MDSNPRRPTTCGSEPNSWSRLRAAGPPKGLSGGIVVGAGGRAFSGLCSFPACGNDRGLLGGHFRRFWFRLPLAAARGQGPLAFFRGSLGGGWGTVAFFVLVVASMFAVSGCTLWVQGCFSCRALGRRRGDYGGYVLVFCLWFAGLVGLKGGMLAFFSRHLPSISRVFWVAEWLARVHSRQLFSGKRQGLWPRICWYG